MGLGKLKKKHEQTWKNLSLVLVFFLFSERVAQPSFPDTSCEMGFESYLKS